MDSVYIYRKGKQIKFTQGQQVRVREWNDMVQEFGTRKNNQDINCEGVFIPSMLHLCGSIAIITYIDDYGYRIHLKFIEFVGCTDFIYSLDMIEPM